MLLRFSLIVAFTFAPLVASQVKPLTHCCTPGADRLSHRTIKAVLDKTEPIQAPCCAEMFHIKGIMVLSVAVDTDGKVKCVEYVSGPPLIIGVSIDSVRQWRFHPYFVKGEKENFCGRISLRFGANEYSLKYEVL